MTDGDVEILSVEQGSDDWRLARIGIPTASNFADVLAGAREVGKGVRIEYLRRLAGERITGIPTETYKSKAMERGSVMEPEIRSQYALLTGVKPEPIGFIKRKMRVGFAGCSPDSFVGPDLVVEYKSMAPHLLIQLYQADRFPPEHVPQCQGAMLVSGRPHCELVVGYGSMPLWRRRLKRDPSYIARLEVGICAFNEELDALVEWINNYGRSAA